MSLNHPELLHKHPALLVSPCGVATNTIIKTESDNSFSDSTTDIKITYIRVTTWSRSHVGKNVPESHVVTEKYDIT